MNKQFLAGLICSSPSHHGGSSRPSDATHVGRRARGRRARADDRPRRCHESLGTVDGDEPHRRGPVARLLTA